jgi:CheY-like chemotaxis protein
MIQTDNIETPSRSAFAQRPFSLHVPASIRTGPESAGGSGAVGNLVLKKLLLENKPGTETILYVEDESVLRAVIADCLAQLGYQVLSAGDGGHALTLAADHKGPIDLLLTDVRMPEMSGPELAAKLLPLRPAMKVIYVSGYPDDIVAIHGSPGPDTVFLAKPFTIKLLAAKLREVLEKQG